MCDACLTFDRSAEVSRIDFGFVDRSVLHAPMLEDLHIRAIVHQLLYGLLHGFSKLGVALLDGGRDVAGLAQAFDADAEAGVRDRPRPENRHRTHRPCP